jgi:Ni/Co efflux regulator RcnB
MKRFAYAALAAALLTAPALAQPHRDDRDGGADWRPGGHVSQEYWGHQHEVDWRAHHLRQPPRGYHWVQNGNNYVLAAVAGGLIASIVAANR